MKKDEVDIMRNYFDCERSRNKYNEAIANSRKAIERYNTDMEIYEFETFGQTLKSLKMMVVNGLATVEAVSNYASNCEKSRYGLEKADYNTYYSIFVTAKEDYKKEMLERKVLNGFTIAELRKCVELEELTKKQAAYYFADKYCKYFELNDDEFEHFYDEDAFDPTCDFGFVPNDDEKDGE